MSETRKLSDILREKIDNQQKTIEKLTERLTKLESPKELSTTLTHKEHTHSSNVEFDCPECKKAYDEQIKKSYREELKKIKDPVMCKDCGEIVERDTEECPTCHGREARNVE